MTQDHGPEGIHLEGLQPTKDIVQVHPALPCGAGVDQGMELPQGGRIGE